MIMLKALKTVFLVQVSKNNYGIWRKFDLFTATSKPQQLFYHYFGITAAPKLFQGIFVIGYNVFVFNTVASVIVKAILTRYSSFSVETRN